MRRGPRPHRHVNTPSTCARGSTRLMNSRCGARSIKVNLNEAKAERGVAVQMGGRRGHVRKHVSPVSTEGVTDVGRVVPSHAFVHVVDFGRPVNVAGIRARDGDLIHADRHGAVVIPLDLAEKVRSAADQIIASERVVIEAARQPVFNFEKLKEVRKPRR